MAVLDTSYLIAIEKREPSAQTIQKEFERTNVYLRVPAPVWIEYLHPMAAAPRQKAAIELDAMTQFEPITREIAEEAADIQHALKQRGKKLGLTDLQIAATAKLFREPVVTRDKRFRLVRDLEVVVF